ncbi:MAG: tetratricopeptide repeat protein [Bacteroidota bacterium]
MRRFLFFALLMLLGGGCGREHPRDILARAEEAQKAGDTNRALREYVRVASEYPGTQEAEAALFRIAAVQTNERRDMAGAVGAYKMYLRDFPEGAQAPTALFLVGYLYNNELGRIDSAAAAYREFLERFPAHEMAPSARYELRTLGRSPQDSLSLPLPSPSAGPAPSPAPAGG